VVKVLAAWDWADRPAGVITLPSRSRPQLIESLGRQIAEVGQMPYLGPLEYAGRNRPAASQFNSAQRLRALWDAFTVPGSVRAALAALGGPVLLVDDRIDTGWTMTVAARLLRAAGAAGVLPFALAVSTG
jgi:ATP-dependent DNA helicase RecQ